MEEFKEVVINISKTVEDYKDINPYDPQECYKVA